MDFTQLANSLEQDGQGASGYTQGAVGGQSWQSGLGQSMAGLSQPVAQPTAQLVNSAPVDISQYGETNEDPNAGMDWGMAGEGRYYPSSGKDIGKHLGDVLPGGAGAPQADPMYQMFGDQVSPVFKGINSVWQAPGNAGQKLGGNVGRFLTVGNPFDLF